jgi:tetratricopeptide (TPR) repeat protein
MRKPVFCLCLLMSLPVFGMVAISGREDPALDQAMKEGMELLFRDNFSKAIRLFSEVRDKYPKHPVGYFLLAAALDAKMVFYYSNVLEGEFMKNCEKAIEIGEERLQKEPNDKWLLFFVGGAYGYMGTFQARYKNYISAFRNGWTGVSLLKQVHAMDPGFVDVLLGLGTYYYWSSRLSKALWWMPGLGDERETGIRQLQKCIEGGRYTSMPAAGNLLLILLEEKRYEEAIRICEKTLSRYPGNRYFLLGMAEAQYRLGDLTEAERLFRLILDLCDSEEFNKNVNSLRCRSALAGIYEKRQMWIKAAAECRRAKQYRFNDTDRIVAKEYLDEVNQILSRVTRNYPLER